MKRIVLSTILWQLLKTTDWQDLLSLNKMYSIETVKNVLTLNIPLSYEAEKKESSIHTFKRHLFILAEHEMANLAGLIHGNDRR